MYIPPFWCGVIATVGIEVAIVLIYAFAFAWKEGRKDEATEKTDV